MSRFTLLLASLTLFIAAGKAATLAAELSAGTARVDLTPPMSMHAPLGGYGARMNRPAEGGA